MIRVFLALAGCVPAEAARPDVVDPHGVATGCPACHAAGVSPSRPGPALPVVETCRSCHPDADMHPVGMAPDTVHVPEAWPLENGVVTCATCHAEPAHGGAFAQLVAPWHREGPYEPITGLCYRCHDAAAYTRSDPHHPITARDASDPTCAACHSGVPDAGATPEASRLRFPTEEACVTCHAGAVHAGVDEHVGESMDPAIAPGLAWMQGGRIACWTCHEIHDRAPLGKGPPDRARAFHDLALGSEWAPLNETALTWPGSSAQDHPPMLALPVDDGALCRACHGAGP